MGKEKLNYQHHYQQKTNYRIQCYSKWFVRNKVNRQSFNLNYVKENSGIFQGCFDMAGNFPEKVVHFDKTRLMDRHFFKFQTQKANGLALVEIPKYIMILTPIIASLPVLAIEGKDKQVRTAHKIAPTFLPLLILHQRIE